MLCWSGYVCHVESASTYLSCTVVECEDLFSELELCLLSVAESSSLGIVDRSVGSYFFD